MAERLDWQVHGARFRSPATWPDEVEYRPQPYVEVLGGHRLSWRRNDRGVLQVAVLVDPRVDPNRPECLESWDVRLMAWEVDEGLAGRRVVWMERETLGGEPCAIEVGYRVGGQVHYDAIPASAILPPPPAPGQPWRETYGPDLMEHIRLYAALDDGLAAVYRAARLSLQEAVALDGQLHALPVDEVARRVRCRRDRIPRLVRSALAAIREAFRIRDVPNRVTSGGQ